MDSSNSGNSGNSKSRTIPLEVQLTQARLKEVSAGKFQPTTSTTTGIIRDPPIGTSELDTLISKYLERIKSTE